MKISRTEYARLHRELAKKYGKACICEGENCSGISLKYDWALRKGCNYSENKEDYLQLCKSCHRKYDFTEAQRNHLRIINSGKKLSPEHIKKWNGLGVELTKKKVAQYSTDGVLIKEWDCILDACRSIGIKHSSSISNCFNGIAKSAKGYQWKLI